MADQVLQLTLVSIGVGFAGEDEAEVGPDEPHRLDGHVLTLEVAQPAGVEHIVAGLPAPEQLRVEERRVEDPVGLDAVVPAEAVGHDPRVGIERLGLGQATVVRRPDLIDRTR